jgi:hypothetical protein
MPIIVVALALLVVLAILALGVPFSIIQRYRNGTARRRARSWVAAINLASIALSAALFFVSVAISNAWIPGALRMSMLGLAGGFGLGVLGLKLSRWEAADKSIYYTPNPWLVLGLTVAVAIRLGYGLWRVWESWRFSSAEEGNWLAASGIAGSMAVGALVAGYYLSFFGGILLRLKAHSVNRKGHAI